MAKQRTGKVMIYSEDAKAQEIPGDWALHDEDYVPAEHERVLKRVSVPMPAKLRRVYRTTVALDRLHNPHENHPPFQKLLEHFYAVGFAAGREDAREEARKQQ